MTRTEEILREISSLNDGIFTIDRLASFLASLEEKIEKCAKYHPTSTDIYNQKYIKEPASWEEHFRKEWENYPNLGQILVFIAEEKGKSFEEGVKAGVARLYKSNEKYLP